MPLSWQATVREGHPLCDVVAVVNGGASLVWYAKEFDKSKYEFVINETKVR